MAENRVIGVNNTLPWHLPADLRHFRELTSGHHVIMGRKTFESLGKPLPHRINIVITSNNQYTAPDCIVVPSLDSAIAAASPAEEIFIIGGASCYSQALPRADRLYLTVVHTMLQGDARFPEFDWNSWNEVARIRCESDKQNPYSYSFITLEKNRITSDVVTAE